MTDLMRKVVSKLEGLPAEKQDYLAEILLEEMESDRKWEELLKRPIEGTRFEQLVKEAKEEISSRQSQTLEEFLSEQSKEGKDPEE